MGGNFSLFNTPGLWSIMKKPDQLVSRQMDQNHFRLKMAQDVLRCKIMDITTDIQLQYLI